MEVGVAEAPGQEATFALRIPVDGIVKEHIRPAPPKICKCNVHVDR
jgi:hypothetical protein